MLNSITAYDSLMNEQCLYWVFLSKSSPQYDWSWWNKRSLWHTERNFSSADISKRPALQTSTWHPEPWSSTSLSKLQSFTWWPDLKFSTRHSPLCFGPQFLCVTGWKVHPTSNTSDSLCHSWKPPQQHSHSREIFTRLTQCIQPCLLWLFFSLDLGLNCCWNCVWCPCG